MPAGQAPGLQSHFIQPSTHIIGVMSGKGGVGKSTITVNLACALAREGTVVGVLDADIYGFSIPRLLGATGPAEMAGRVILPLERSGVKFVSMGNFVGEGAAIVWRGPQLAETVRRLIGRVYWAGVEYLLIDFPPGTGDVAMTVAEALPGLLVLLVTTPQRAAAAVAIRAARMARRAALPILGVVENMAYFEPACGGPAQYPFGRGGGGVLAETLGVPLLGRIPLDVRVRQGGDAGRPVVLSPGACSPARAFQEVAGRLRRLCSP
jgi:ATP-binding protein involved in chromosome partitioning